MMDDPKCPHCGKEIEDMWDYQGLDMDGDIIKEDCPNCGGAIILRVEITYKYEATKDPNPEIKRGEPGNCT